MGKTNGTFKSTKLSRAVRCTLLLLLVALALTTTVSFAQGGAQGPSAEVDLVVEPPPPEPEPEPPQITLPPAEPGEEQFIAQVTIESSGQLAALQQLGFSCGEAAVCEIVATEAQLSALREAGFTLDIVGVVVEYGHEDGLEDDYRYGVNNTNVDIDAIGTSISGIGIAGAPATAKVNLVKYDC